MGVVSAYIEALKKEFEYREEDFFEKTPYLPNDLLNKYTRVTKGKLLRWRS